jgi:hypothetical protein
MRRQISWDHATATLTVGTRARVVPCAPGDNECFLRTFVELVAMQRRVRKGADLDLRRDDIAVLAELLDLDDADLEARLARILLFDADEAAQVHRLLKLAAAATVGAGLLASSALPAAADDASVAADKAIGRPPASVVVTDIVDTDIDDAVVYERPAVDPAPGPEVEIGDALVIERSLP